MLFLAETALEKAKEVPVKFWFQAGGLILGLIVGVLLLKWILPKLAQANKILLCAVLFAAFAIIGFRWVYERNEPAILTPFVQVIAPFFPSKEAQKKPPPPGSTPPKGPVPAPTPVRGMPKTPEKKPEKK